MSLLTVHKPRLEGKVATDRVHKPQLEGKVATDRVHKPQLDGKVATESGHKRKLESKITTDRVHKPQQEGRVTRVHPKQTTTGRRLQSKQTTRVYKPQLWLTQIFRTKDVLLVELMYLVFTRMPDESYRR